MKQEFDNCEKSDQKWTQLWKKLLDLKKSALTLKIVTNNGNSVPSRRPVSLSGCVHKKRPKMRNK